MGPFFIRFTRIFPKLLLGFVLLAGAVLVGGAFWGMHEVRQMHELPPPPAG